jgi:hypothetical protein
LTRTASGPSSTASDRPRWSNAALVVAYTHCRRRLSTAEDELTFTIDARRTRPEAIAIDPLSRMPARGSHSGYHHCALLS